MPSDEEVIAHLDDVISGLREYADQQRELLRERTDEISSLRKRIDQLEDENSSLCDEISELRDGAETSDSDADTARQELGELVAFIERQHNMDTRHTNTWHWCSDPICTKAREL